MTPKRAMIEIATAEPSDALELKALILDAFGPVAQRLGYRPSPMDRAFDAALADRMTFRARIEQGARDRAAGFIVVSAQKRHLYVDVLAVDPRRQGLGVGSALLSAVETLAAELCFPAIELNTDPRLTDVTAFYRRAGFQEVARPTTTLPPTVRFRRPVATRLDQILGRAPKDARA